MVNGIESIILWICHLGSMAERRGYPVRLRELDNQNACANYGEPSLYSVVLELRIQLSRHGSRE